MVIFIDESSKIDCYWFIMLLLSNFHSILTTINKWSRLLGCTKPRIINSECPNVQYPAIYCFIIASRRSKQDRSNIEYLYQLYKCRMLKICHGSFHGSFLPSMFIENKETWKLLVWCFICLL